MTRIKADLIRNPDSVLVGVRNPNTVAPVTPIERHYSDWADVATEIASEAQQATPASLPTEIPEPPAIMPADEVRVYSVGDGGRLKPIYTGEYTDDIDDRCKAYADLSGRVVWLMSATDAVPFDPATPKQDADSPPIGDVESNSVLVYNDSRGELIWAGNETKGFACRCQKYANTHNTTLKVISKGGMLTRFYVPREVSMAQARENLRNSKALATVGEVVSILAIGVASWATLIVL